MIDRMLQWLFEASDFPRRIAWKFGICPRLGGACLRQINLADAGVEVKQLQITLNVKKTTAEKVLVVKTFISAVASWVE